MSTENTEVVNLLVKIDGKEEVKASSQETWSTRNGNFVTAMSIDQRLDAPDAFSIQFMGSHEGQLTVLDFVKEGAEIELGFGYDKPISTLFKGEIVYVEADFETTLGSFVTLRGYDHSHRLTRGFSAKTWGDGEKEDQVISDLVKEVIQNSKEEKGGSSDGLSADKVDSTEFKSRYIPKAMTTDYDFIKWAGSSLARASDSDQKDDKKVSFRKLDIKQNPVCTVFFDKPKGSGAKKRPYFRARFNMATYPQYAKVRVHGWNTAEKKAFVGEKESCSAEIDGASANSGWTSGWSAAGKAHYGSGSAGAVYERVMEFCETKEEAEKIAQGVFDSFSLRYFTGEVDCLGCADIVPGCVVELAGFGERVSGKVLVTEVSHHISSAAGQPYTTSFKFCSNAAGPAK